MGSKVAFYPPEDFTLILSDICQDDIPDVRCQKIMVWPGELRDLLIDNMDTSRMKKCLAPMAPRLKRTLFHYD
jgi:hypothetical protein